MDFSAEKMKALLQWRARCSEEFEAEGFRVLGLMGLLRPEDGLTPPHPAERS